MKKQIKIKPPSELENIKNATAKIFSDRHSLTLVSRRTVLSVEAEELSKCVVGLNAAIKTAARRREEVLAQIAGLESVLAKR